MTLELRTLVLNADMTPISIFPLHAILAKNAVVRCVNGTAYPVAEYDRLIKTQHTVMHWPAVIARTEYIRLRRHAALKRHTLFYRDKGKCAYCGCDLTLDDISIDHVIPRDLGGEHKWDNVVACCSRCNSQKSNSPPTGRWEPRNKPWIPTHYSLLRNRREFPIVIGHESWMDWLGPWNAKVIVRE